MAVAALIISLISLVVSCWVGWRYVRIARGVDVPVDVARLRKQLEQYQPARDYLRAMTKCSPSIERPGSAVASLQEIEEWTRLCDARFPQGMDYHELTNDLRGMFDLLEGIVANPPFAGAEHEVNTFLAGAQPAMNHYMEMGLGEKYPKTCEHFGLSRNPHAYPRATDSGHQDQVD